MPLVKKTSISIKKKPKQKNKGQKEGSRYFTLYRIPNCILLPDQPTGKWGDMKQEWRYHVLPYQTECLNFPVHVEL